VAPTRRELILRGLNIFRVRDGHITERWGRLDQLVVGLDIRVDADQPGELFCSAC
jgi:hypothetical protein